MTNNITSNSSQFATFNTENMFILGDWAIAASGNGHIQINATRTKDEANVNIYTSIHELEKIIDKAKIKTEEQKL